MPPPEDPRPGQPAWDDTDYARDFEWLGQPRTPAPPPPAITVRQWFRLARGAFWRSGDGSARYVDDLARLIVFAHSRCPADRVDTFTWMYVPEEWEARQVALDDAAQALDALLAKAYRAHICPPDEAEREWDLRRYKDLWR